ncbi:MAG: NAD(P)/FAD-dependent oxidoreductase [Gaiellaceae bacterium]
MPWKPVRRQQRRRTAGAGAGAGQELRRTRPRRRAPGRALTPPTSVIVGGGLAGATPAATLREESFDGRIMLIGAEDHPPYERPPLSKEYLRGEAPFENGYVRPPDFYDENGIKARLGTRAARVEPSERVVELEDGERVRYDKLLLATGGRNRRLTVPGVDLEGVYDLRTVEGADRLRAAAEPRRRAVVVGMGFIGSEITASLRQLGVEVEVVAPGSAPLERVLGEEVGAVLEKIHREHGVELHFGDPAAAFEGVDRVERLVTVAGRRIECDFAVVGVGIEPVTELAAGTGIELENGILVDEYCRTNVDGIYAAGDVANHFNPVFGRRIRVEHWDNARKQGSAAARSMLGKAEPYEEVYWFWSDQYDTNLQYAGFHTSWDELVVRGSLEERSFVAFYCTEGRVLAAVAVNRGKDLRRSIPLISHLVVPVRVSHLHFLTDDEADERREAEESLSISVGLLRQRGISTTAMVGSDKPLESMTDALGSFPATRVLLVTPPKEEAYWLERGLLAKARALTKLPVTQIVVPSAAPVGPTSEARRAVPI